MPRKRRPLSFDNAVRLGARVPLLFSLLVLVLLAVATTSLWPSVEDGWRGSPGATAEASKAQRELLRVGHAAIGLSLDAGIPHLVLVTSLSTRRQVLGLLGLAAFAALAAGWVIVRSIRTIRNPLSSSVGRALSRWGDPPTVRAAFDDAMAEEHPIVGALHGIRGFIAFRGRSGFRVVPRADVIWVHQKPGPNPVFLSVAVAPWLLFGSVLSRSLYIHERSGRRLRVLLSSRYERDAVMTELQSLCPHTIYEDNDATRKFWRDHRSQFVDTVDKRRTELEVFLSGVSTPR